MSEPQKPKSYRLQFTDEERASPELDKYIKKSEKAADRYDKASTAIPKKNKLVKERTFDETTGKAKTRLHFEKQDKPPSDARGKHKSPLRPVAGAEIYVHGKIHEVEKDNSGDTRARNLPRARRSMERGSSKRATTATSWGPTAPPPRLKKRLSRQTQNLSIKRRYKITRRLLRQILFPALCKNSVSSASMQRRRKKAVSNRQRKPPRMRAKPRRKRQRQPKTPFHLWRSTRKAY